MKIRHLFLLAAAFAVARQTAGQIVFTEPTVTRTATITLGSNILITDQVPITVLQNTHVQMIATFLMPKNSKIVWQRDGKPLPETGLVLDIPAASRADNGNYTASFEDMTQQVDILVTGDGHRLQNVSNLGRVSAEQPTLVTGFVVEPGPSSANLLVRAIGPALMSFGISDPLAAPQLKIVDSRGAEVRWWGYPWDLSSYYTPDLGRRLGAFPIPLQSKDITHVYRLPAGAYTAQITSADGGTGTVLLEIYDANDNLP